MEHQIISIHIRSYSYLIGYHLEECRFKELIWARGTLFRSPCLCRRHTFRPSSRRAYASHLKPAAASRLAIVCNSWLSPVERRSSRSKRLSQTYTRLQYELATYLNSFCCPGSNEHILVCFLHTARCASDSNGLVAPVEIVASIPVRPGETFAAGWGLIRYSLCLPFEVQNYDAQISTAECRECAAH